MGFLAFDQVYGNAWDQPPAVVLHSPGGKICERLAGHKINLGQTMQGAEGRPFFWWRFTLLWLGSKGRFEDHRVVERGRPALIVGVFQT